MHGGFPARVNYVTRGWVNYLAFFALMRVNYLAFDMQHMKL